MNLVAEALAKVKRATRDQSMPSGGSFLEPVPPHNPASPACGHSGAARSSHLDSLQAAWRDVAFKKRFNARRLERVAGEWL